MVNCITKNTYTVPTVFQLLFQGIRLEYRSLSSCFFWFYRVVLCCFICLVIDFTALINNNSENKLLKKMSKDNIIVTASPATLQYKCWDNGFGRYGFFCRFAKELCKITCATQFLCCVVLVALSSGQVNSGFCAPCISKQTGSVLSTSSSISKFKRDF